MNTKKAEEFREALNRACGEINEAARLSSHVFDALEQDQVRRELARLMETIDTRILSRLRPR